MKFVGIVVVFAMVLFLMGGVSASDNETYFTCNGDAETMMGCTFGDIENTPLFGLDVVIPSIVIDFPNTDTINTKTFEIRVTTDKPTECTYDIDGSANASLDTLTQYLHTKTITLGSNRYDLNVFCTDLFGNEQNETFNFFISDVADAGGSSDGPGGGSC